MPRKEESQKKPTSTYNIYVANYSIKVFENEQQGQRPVRSDPVSGWARHSSGTGCCKWLPGLVGAATPLLGWAELAVAGWERPRASPAK